MSKLNAYFKAHKSLTLGMMWLFFFLALAYALCAMYVAPQLNFWLMLFPAAIALYFRVMYAKASYDPTKDRFSPEYIPFEQRKQQRQQFKKKRKKSRK